jgi:hypothetical protein
MPPDAANAAGVPSRCNIDVYLTFDVMRITHSMLECESSAEVTEEASADAFTAAYLEN